MKKFFIPIILAAVVVGFVFAYGLGTISVAAQVNNNIDSLMDGIEKSLTENPKNLMSSSPYTYVKNNKYFDAIVDLGPDALPIIEKTISDSPKNGLKEYILAIAGEKIAKVNLKGDSVRWGTAKQWVTVWNEHLKEIPSNVKKIAESDSHDKTKELIQLGTPAIPFLMDLVEENNADVIPALAELLKDNKQKIDVSAEEITKEWVKENKGKFANLREMVNKKQMNN